MENQPTKNPPEKGTTPNACPTPVADEHISEQNRTYFLGHLRAQQKKKGQNLEQFNAPTRQLNAVPADQLPESTKSRIYRQFKAAEEYELPWLNNQSQSLILTSDDTPILKYWTKTIIKYDTTGWTNIKNLFTIMFYFGIYAILTYFISDRGQGNLNNSVQAFFFPVFPYILIAYRSLEKYIKAVIAAVITLLVSWALLQNNLIDWRGILFLRYFPPILRILPFIDNFVPQLAHFETFLLSLNTNVEKIQFTLILIGVFFVVEFIILILHALFREPATLEWVISKKYMFVREKSKKSYWEDVKLIFSLIFSWFNIKQYVDIRNRIRYNRQSSLEGRIYDFGRFSSQEIKHIFVQENTRQGLFAIAILFFIVGSITLKIGIGIPFFLLGVIFAIRSFTSPHTFRIKIIIDRNKVDGSWILSHTYDTLIMDNVRAEIAQSFTQCAGPHKK